MQQVKITVEVPVLHPAGTFKVIYRNTLSYPNGVAIPFSALYSGLRLLYPQENAYIIFNVSCL